MSKRHDRIKERVKSLRDALLRGNTDHLDQIISEITDLSVEEAGDNVSKLGEKEKPIAYCTSDLENVSNVLNSLIKRLKKHGIID